MESDEIVEVARAGLGENTVRVMDAIDMDMLEELGHMCEHAEVIMGKLRAHGLGQSQIAGVLCSALLSRVYPDDDD